MRLFSLFFSKCPKPDKAKENVEEPKTKDAFLLSHAQMINRNLRGYFDEKHREENLENIYFHLSSLSEYFYKVGYNESFENNVHKIK